MLPNLRENQQVYIEITNPIHGGPGWEFGSCLWSPIKNKGGQKSWRIMEKIHKNDFIVHLLKYERGYYWTGFSQVESAVSTSEQNPPIPTNWANMKPYQRINLQKYTKIRKPISIKDFFIKHERQLKELHQGNHSQFFVVYGQTQELRIAQRYIAFCSIELYELFQDFSNVIEFNPSLVTDVTHVPSEHEPSYPDYSTPNRQNITMSRIIRDTKITRELKTETDWRCQICGIQIELSDGKFYAEGHHLQPLGSYYNGPDIKENIIILCPNHHAEFDYGSMAINPNSNRVIHKNINNKYHNKRLAYKRANLVQEFIKFHYENIFMRV